ncbi:ribonuclease R [Marinospirillum perlucidum]|uniref:ribonuclease R n=1 Tax=Marinospirillum perlucidum TaxID=1982602 RepID=UPI000DF462CA|nr:ribonuclease R [Marinospirillum perlucidum]
MTTSWPLDQDPQALSEADRYDHPVPSREYILQCLEEAGRPMTHEQLCRAYGMTHEDSIEALRRRLIAMARDNQLFSNRRGAYALINKLDLIKGRVQAHRDGFGFLVPEAGGSDLFLHNKQLRKVWDGDLVLVREVGKDGRGRREGVVVEVLERGVKQLVGRLKFQSSGFALVIPENPSLHHEVLVPPDQLMGAKEGEMVQVEILEHPAPRKKVVGRITEVLGDFMSPGMEIEVALRSYDLPFEWPDEVTRQANQLSAQVEEDDKKNRVDLRNLPLVTIDGEDAKDFDDAVYCQKSTTGGWKLWVAIADVSHYVRAGSPLDQEAHKRATSVYFPGRVIPMLPEALSNGLCSLNPQVDRLCMVCEMNISKQGKLTRYKFYEGVMRSQARLTYTQVGALLDAPESEAAQYLYDQHAQLLPGLYELHNLYKALRHAREERGAIDFETRETRIIFGADRKIEKIVPVERNDAHKIIEECMLAANVATARFLEKHRLPALYRVHEGPKAERLETLRAFLGELGIHLEGGEDPTPQDYQEVFNSIRERPDAEIIQTMMLRSMRQAVYTPENEGHFGLAYNAYAHFTSPIRRYPDLLVHRAIRGLIRSGQKSSNVERLETTPQEKLEKWLPYTTQQMVELGEHCSMAERRADEAVRDVTDWLKCEFLSDHVGEVFTGRVASVVGFGLFVELHDFFVEGLVHISSLPGDYYRFEPEKQRLRGERSGRSWRLGDEVEVIVSRVDLDDRKIDFDLTETLAVPARQPHKRRRPAAKSKPAATSPAEEEKTFEPRVASPELEEDGKKKKKKAKKKKDKAGDEDKSKKSGKKRKKRPGKKERAKKKKAKKD